MSSRIASASTARDSIVRKRKTGTTDPKIGGARQGKPLEQGAQATGAEASIEAGLLHANTTRCRSEPMVTGRWNAHASQRVEMV